MTITRLEASNILNLLFLVAFLATVNGALMIFLIVQISVLLRRMRDG